MRAPSTLSIIIVTVGISMMLRGIVESNGSLAVFRSQPHPSPAL